MMLEPSYYRHFHLSLKAKSYALAYSTTRVPWIRSTSIPAWQGDKAELVSRTTRVYNTTT